MRIIADNELLRKQLVAKDKQNERLAREAAAASALRVERDQLRNRLLALRSAFGGLDDLGDAE